MRHQIVTRIVLSLAALWAAAVVVFAWGTTRPLPPPGAATARPGEDLFARHCAMCHDVSDIAIAWRESPDREAAVTAFRAFLVDHYGPSPEGNAAIVDHVMTR